MLMLGALGSPMTISPQISYLVAAVSKKQRSWATYASIWLRVVAGLPLSEAQRGVLTWLALLLCFPVLHGCEGWVAHRHKGGPCACWGVSRVAPV
jgi:hypothetical protein